MDSLPQIIGRHSTKLGDDKRLHFLKDVGQVESALSYKEIHEKSALIASALSARQAKGRPVLLLCSTNEVFVLCFLGCLYSGAIAVPCAIPGKKRNEAYDRLLAVVNNTAPNLILTDESNKSGVESLLRREGISGSVLSSEELIDSTLGEHVGRPDSNDPAFIQFSSGTTSKPKGVVITHGNITSNLEIITTKFRTSSDTRLFGWLPLFHDMGLIGNLLGMIHAGGTGFLISPHAFMQKPERWLRGISMYKADTSGGPNFAYDLCINKIPEERLDDIDLSCWQVAFNGAEVIRPNTIKAFSEKFGRCGFNHEAFLPCYGLAEATLLVSGVQLKNVEKTPGVQVSSVSEHSRHTSGTVCNGIAVSIVNPKTGSPVRDGTTAEIWVAGDSITRGYWQSDDTSFQDDSAFGYLDGRRHFRTGDLGYLENGHLYVAGRIKETIIIRGKNYQPTDIEASVSKLHEAFVANGSAALTVDSGSDESLIIVQEIERAFLRNPNFAGWQQLISAHISNVYGVTPKHIAFVIPGRLLRTTSGKLKRLELAKQFQAGQLKLLNPLVEQTRNSKAAETGSAPLRDSDAIKEWIVDRIQRELSSVDQFVTNDTPFSELGMSSSVAVGLTGELGEILGMQLEPTLFWEYDTIDELVEGLAKQTVMEMEA